MKQKPFILIFCLIMLVGFLLRVWQFNTIPAGLYWDEIAILVDSKVVAATGFDMHLRPWYQVIYPSYGDYKLPVYIWLTTLGVKFISSADWIVRLPSLIAGLGTVLVAGWLARKLFATPDKRSQQQLQLVSMLVVALLPWSIHFSRTGFEGHLGQFLFGLSILFTLKSKKHWAWSVAAAVIAVLAVYSYFSVRFVWPVVFIAAQLIILSEQHQRKLIRKTVLQAILPLIIFVGLLWPMMNSPLYPASNQLRLSTPSVLNNYDYPLQANIYRQAAGNTPLDRVLFHRDWLMARQLAANASDFIDPAYLFLTGDPNLRHGTGQFGLLLLATAPFFVWGMMALWQQQKSSLALLIIWWAMSILPAAVPNETPHALRSLNALIPLSLLVSYGLWSGWQWWQNWSASNQLKQLVLGVTILAIGLNLAAFMSHYLVVYPQQSARDWQAGYRRQAENVWAEALAQPDQEITLENTDDRFYLWLLAYGPLTPQEIQDLAKPNYRPERIKNILLKQ